MHGLSVVMQNNLSIVKTCRLHLRQPFCSHTVTRSTLQKERVMGALMSFSDVFCWQLKIHIYTKGRQWSPKLHPGSLCSQIFGTFERKRRRSLAYSLTLLCHFLLLFKFSSTKVCLQIYLLLCSCGCVLLQVYQCLVECVGVCPGLTSSFCSIQPGKKKRVNGQNTAVSEKVKNWN